MRFTWGVKGKITRKFTSLRNFQYTSNPFDVMKRDGAKRIQILPLLFPCIKDSSYFHNLLELRMFRELYYGPVPFTKLQSLGSG